MMAYRCPYCRTAIVTPSYGNVGCPHCRRRWVQLRVPAGRHGDGYVIDVPAADLAAPRAERRPRRPSRPVSPIVAELAFGVVVFLAALVAMFMFGVFGTMARQ